MTDPRVLAQELTDADINAPRDDPGSPSPTCGGSSPLIYSSQPSELRRTTRRGR
jgi:hypothetical protein